MNWFWFIVHGVHRNGSSLHRLWANWVILSKTNLWPGKCPLSRNRKTEINPPKMEEIQVLHPVPVGCWIHFLCTYWSYKFTASAHPPWWWVCNLFQTVPVNCCADSFSLQRSILLLPYFIIFKLIIFSLVHNVYSISQRYVSAGFLSLYLSGVVMWSLHSFMLHDLNWRAP